MSLFLPSIAQARLTTRCGVGGGVDKLSVYAGQSDTLSQGDRVAFCGNSAHLRLARVRQVLQCFNVNDIDAQDFRQFL